MPFKISNRVEFNYQLDPIGLFIHSLIYREADKTKGSENAIQANSRALF